MKEKKVKNIIHKIAKNEGIKESEVRAEMQHAILTGFLNTETNQMWGSLFGVGNLPSPEEFIITVLGLVVK